jgi:hypothetical protein
MRTTRVPPSLCPICGHFLDAASSITDPEGTPNPGDVSLCIGCGFRLMFDQQLRLRLPTVAEQRETEGHPDVRMTQAALRHMHATIGRPPGKRTGHA